MSITFQARATTRVTGRASSERIADTFFYALDRAIKTYRQFAQARIGRSRGDITIDQWLVLKTIQENPDVTQQGIGTLVFKDFASVTRIIQLLVARGFLSRSAHARDGRRSALALTRAGKEAIRSLDPIVHGNRREALRGIAPADLARAQALLDTIVANCGPEPDRPGAR